MTGRYRERFPIAISEVQESRLADQIFGISRRTQLVQLDAGVELFLRVEGS
jgi:hypothetical protein